MNVNEGKIESFKIFRIETWKWTKHIYHISTLKSRTTTIVSFLFVMKFHWNRVILFVILRCVSIIYVEIPVTSSLHSLLGLDFWYVLPKIHYHFYLNERVVAFSWVEKTGAGIIYLILFCWKTIFFHTLFQELLQSNKSNHLFYFKCYIATKKTYTQSWSEAALIRK